MWRSTDLGATWANIPAAGGFESSPPTTGPGDQDGTAGSGCQCGYDQTVGVDPLDANRLYIGFQQLWLSINAATPSPGSVAFGGSAITASLVHFYHHALVFSPASHEVTPPTYYPIYVGTDGGIADSTDGGTTWNNINGNPVTGVGAIGTILFNGIDIGRGSPTNNKATYGGSARTGTEEFRPPFVAQTWHSAIDGTGGPVAVDPGNPAIAIGSDDGASIRTTSAGSAWTNPIPSLPGTIGAVAFDQIPADKIAYAASFQTPDSFIYQSMDEGATWNQMHLVPSDVGITSIATTPADGNTVWVGLNDGTLTFTNTALLGNTALWNNATVTGAPAMQPVSAVAIDPTNPKVVVVTYPGFSGINPDLLPTKHVFMTTDSGATWTDISGTAGGGIQNLPDIPVNSVTIDPNTTPHTIIIGTDAAVMQTADDGNSWQVLGIGLPNVQVTSVQLDSNATPELLRVGTYGRSVFELDPPSVPLLQVNSNFNFGTVCKPGSFTETLQLFNVGAGTLNISSIARVAGSNDFSLSPPSAPLAIPAGGEVDYTIVYTPSLPNVTETATFQINSNDPFNPAQQVTYTATSGAPVAGTVIATSGNFGNVCLGSFTDLTLTVTNSGTCDLHITNLATSNPLFSLPTVGLSLPIVVHPGTSVGLPITYTPTAVTSVPDTANITVTTDDPVNPVQMVAVMGTSSDTGKLSVSIAPSGNYGNVCLNSFKDLNLTLTNGGSCDLSATNITSSNPLFAVASVMSYPLVVHSGTSVAIPIRYTPTAITTTPDTANITVDSTDVHNPTLVVPVEGSSPSGKVAASIAPSGNFGNVCRGSFSDLNLTISNNGVCPLHTSDVTSSNPLFTIAEVISFPLTIQSGTSVAIPIRYTPTAITTTPDMSTIDIDSDDSTTPTLGVSTQGSSAPGKIAVTGAANFGNVCAENSKQESFDVNNVGLSICM